MSRQSFRPVLQSCSGSRDDYEQCPKDFEMQAGNWFCIHWSRMVIVDNVASQSQVMNALSCLFIEADEIQRGPSDPDNRHEDKRGNDPRCSGVRNSQSVQKCRNCEDRKAGEGLVKRDASTLRVDHTQFHPPLSESLPFANPAVERGKVNPAYEKANQPTPRTEFPQFVVEDRTNSRSNNPEENTVQIGR